MTPPPTIVKCRIAESLLSCGELFDLSSRVKTESDKEILIRAIQSNGGVVKELLAMYGLPPESGAKIYTEIMNTADNGDREVYHKMSDEQKTKILIINSKLFI